MRVMLIVNEFPPEKIAGTAMATQALAEQLTMKGHQVCVLVTTTCPASKQANISKHDYELIWLKTRPFRGLGWFWKIGQTLKHAKEFSPDVIQGQAVSCGLIAGIVGRLLAIPSICYAQGYDVYQASFLQRQTEIRWGCSLPNQCFAVTQNLKAAIHDVVDTPITLMPHAFLMPEHILKREEARDSFALRAQQKIVLNVARLEYFKGHDVLLRAWVKCVKEYPDIELWIAGSGSMQAELKSKAISLNIHQHVRFLGYLPPQAIHSRMQAADLFVLPSRSEPFGIVLLEAMAHGLPVVASDVGGIPEVLPKDGAAWLVPVEDEHELAKAILTTLEGHSAPSVHNTQYAQNFTWDNQVQQFENIYVSMTSHDE